MNINEHIKKFSLKNMFPYGIALFITVLLLLVLPIRDTFTPQKLQSIWNYNPYEDSSYVSVVVDELYYSGYSISRTFGGEYGYYYTLNNDQCTFVLIPVSDVPEEFIQEYKLFGQVVSADGKASFDKMVSSLATDLNWNEKGLREISTDYIISNADYYPELYFVILIILIACFTFVVYMLALNYMYFRNPASYPVCPRLRTEVKKRLIAKANKELENNLIYEDDGLYMTDHYFIEYSKKKVLLIPLLRVVWCYRMGVANKKTAKYNLYFVLKSGDTIAVNNYSGDQTQNILHEIRGMNLDIICGYTDTKRKKAEEIIDSQ